MNVKINDSTQSTEINWDKPQLMEYTGTEFDRCVILSTGRYDRGDYFEGIDLETSELSGTYLKQDFKPFNGTITLSND